MAIVRHKQPPLRRLMMYGVDHVRQAFASLGELWRNPLASLMTLAVLGVSLALPSCFHVLLKNAEVVEGSWQTSSQISLYLRKDLPEQSILDMKQRILLYPEVESVTYMNRDEALKEFREISGFGDALDYLDSNPLPPVLSVIPDPRWQNPEGAAELLAKLENEPGIEQGKLDTTPLITHRFPLSEIEEAYRIFENRLDGVIKVAIFLAYLILCSKMKDMKRVFAYHGAEHKTIFCYEAGLPLTVENVQKFSRLHPRCGTNFLLIVMLVSIFVFAFLGWPTLWERIASRILLLPVVAGISYEIIRLAGRSENPVIQTAIKPGLWLQYLTTRPPEDDMVEVAIESLKAVLPQEEIVEGSGEYIKTGAEPVQVP